MEKFKSFFSTGLNYAQVSAGNIPDLNYTILIVLFVVFVALLIAFSLGRSRVLLALVSLYIASFINSLFPYYEDIKKLIDSNLFNINEFILRIAIFLIIYALIILVLNNSSLSSKLTLSESSTSAVVILGFLGLGFLASVMSSYIPNDLVSNNILYYFNSPLAIFAWAILPILGVWLVSRAK